MNERNPRMTYLLIGGAAIGFACFLFWQFVLTPYWETEQSILVKTEEVEKKRKERDERVITLNLNEKRMRQMSLPSDVTLASNEYGKLVRGLMLSAKLQLQTFTPLKQETRSAPKLAGGKPAYTKISYFAQVRGDLFSVVDFLYAFYRQPLLHEIRKIVIQPPKNTGGSRGRSDDLELTMNIDALIIDRAENRPTLIAVPPPMAIMTGGAGTTAWLFKPKTNSGIGSPFTASGILAQQPDIEPASSDKKHNPSKTPTTPSQYVRMTGKNIFLGPPPPEQPPQQPERKNDMDYAPYVKLNSIVHRPGVAIASARNTLKKEDHDIFQKVDGTIRVEHHYYLTTSSPRGTVTTRKRYEFNNEGRLGVGVDIEGVKPRIYTVIRLLENEVLLQKVEDAVANEKLCMGASYCIGGTVFPVIPGKIYSWQLGQSLAEAMDNKENIVPAKVAAKYVLTPLGLSSEEPDPDTIPVKLSEKKRMER